MKKILAIILAALLVVSLFGATVYAEEEPTNYLKTEWEGKRFAGDIKVTEEDGVKVYTYTPKKVGKWVSPTISIFDAIKDLIGDADDAEVVFSFEVRGIFKEEGDSASAKMLIRAVNPKTNAFSFPEDDAWDSEGNTWNDAYEEATEGDRLFGAPNKGNVMKSALASADIVDDEWTLVQSDPVYISALNLNTDFFGDWILCMDNIEQYSEDGDDGLVSIQVRNAAVYNAEEMDVEEEEPTPEPTEEPTPAPTAAAATATPEATAEATATVEPVDTTGGIDTTLLIVIIVCAVVVIGAAAAFVIIKKKKDGQSE